MDTLTTSEAAVLIGAHESSIKRWCDAGRLPCALTPGGHRRIGLDELLAFAEREQLPGTILRFGSHVRTLWNGLQQVREADDYAPLQELAHRWLSEGASDLMQPLLPWLMEQGIPFARACDRLIGPVMQRVGHGWQRGLVDPGAEHVITHVLLDSLYALRLSLLSRAGAPARSRPVALVGCGPESGHEIGAQCVRVVLEEAGWRAVYLGPRLPLEDAGSLQERFGASLVCLSMTWPHVAADMMRAARSLARGYRPDRPYRLALGGQEAPQPAALADARLPFEEVRVFEEVAPFAEWLRSLSFPRPVTP